ncbi:hypothetical protein ACFQFR_03315 [Streptomyces goshikiensis]
MLIADYDVNVDPEVYDVTTWAQAMAEHRARHAKTREGRGPAVAPPGPLASPPRTR